MAQLEKQAFLERWREILAPYSLGYRLRLLSQLVRRKFQAYLEPFGLTASHWVVLCCLWEEDGIPTSTICERLQQLGGTMTGVLDGMEKRELIRRQRDPKDRRIWRVYLTPAGEKLKEILPPLIWELREQTYGCLSLEERATLSRLVDRLIAHLSEESEAAVVAEPHHRLSY
ncbi:MarR family transcriptional regulator, organic hydroperoxide resistance regulator [Thermostichus sp. MS-CIW-21]|jgi:DNA-binding MarR family transcriptional regulator|uniref:MarR family winged helix-turn-helix transcriptional regulator n=1 Tax=unclassified Synechococcus TaxID=2626047 RepID=UPI000C19BC93|nr:MULTISPECIES: MarR family transcriptional regulator [unclassified Synechococcus]PIK84709.1 MarR family transcriptional regulator [Synechococcus sp. 65AY6A5]PIK95676.1 MarR family transcriptional regulator [Synechococcus sp. 60AY4M2]PIK97917.1 MarR family transcriptional regulator [Synechococcus sp. 63AY4M1]PIL01358.1 MarR family transcriptional regulator [Synechococcus sp. 65AY640]